MTAAEYVYELLSNVSAIVAVVGDKIEPLENAQGDAVPRLTYFVLDETPVDHHTETEELVEVVVDVDCFGATYAESKQLAELVRSAMVNLADAAVIDNARDLRDDGTRNKSVLLSFRLWHVRTI